MNKIDDNRVSLFFSYEVRFVFMITRKRNETAFCSDDELMIGYYLMTWG